MTKTLLIVAVLVIAAVGHAAPADSDLPVLGDTTSGIISLEQERKLGQGFLRSLRARAPTVSDPLLKDYLEHLIYRLAEHSQLQDRRLDLVILNSRELNAFAVPGGIVGINLGLFIYGETQHEFSSILAHELAHISQRHYARGVESSRKAMIPALAGMLASIVLIATTGGDAGMAAISASQGLSQQMQLAYSRAREAEADRVGIVTLAKAGMDPRAMAYMFERLNKMNRYSGSSIPEFLRTHPVTQSRVSDSYNQASRYEARHFGYDLDYQMMRVRVLLSNGESPDVAVKRMRDGLKTENPVINEAYQYGLALALNRSTRSDEALEVLRPLLEKYPHKIALQIARADVEMQAQRYENAAAILERHLQISPGNFPLSMRYADALLRTGDVKKAVQVLEQQVTQRANDPDIWYLLAEAYGLADNIIGVHQARAEYFALNGNFDQATRQLQYALPLVKDNYQMTAKISQKIEDIYTLRQDSL